MHNKRKRIVNFLGAASLIILYRILPAFVCLCLLSGCTPKPQPRTPALARYAVSFVGPLDTVTNFTAYCPTQAVFDQVSNQVEAELNRLDTLFNHYNPDSPLARINAAAGTVPSEDTPPEILELLAYCREKQTSVQGVNVAMGAVLSLWNQARESGVPPTAAAVEEAMRHVSMDGVCVRDTRLTLSDSAMTLDFGAVAKGFAAKKLAQIVTEAGIGAFLLDCGTSTLVCAGTPPDKDGWQIAVRHPDAALNLSGSSQPDEILGTLSLQNRCVGVSGDYQKYFEANGTYYAHILSPDTGWPASSYRMVCVLTDDAADADNYSTALFALPYEQSRQTAEEAPGLQALWMMEDGSIRTTGGFPAFSS